MPKKCNTFAIKKSMKIVEIEPVFTNNEHRANFKKSLLYHEFISYQSRPNDIETFIDRSNDADVIIVSNIPITKPMLDVCKNLKMISVAFSGLDHIDLEECKKRGILVVNAAGYSTQSVAELTLGLIFDLLRKISELNNKTRLGGDRNGFLGTELFGKRVGIIGAGLIGNRVGEMLNLLGCDVFYTSNKKKDDIKWGEWLCLNDLLQQSDIISLHVPLNDKTENLIDSKAISLMKDGAIIVNTARGKVVNQSALITGLNSGKIGGAAIDVFDQEPPLMVNNPLLNAPNCVLTPHIAYATVEAFENRAQIVSANILKWINS